MPAAFDADTEYVCMPDADEVVAHWMAEHVRPDQMKAVGLPVQDADSTTCVPTVGV